MTISPAKDTMNLFCINIIRTFLWQLLTFDSESINVENRSRVTHAEKRQQTVERKGKKVRGRRREGGIGLGRSFNLTCRRGENDLWDHRNGKSSFFSFPPRSSRLEKSQGIKPAGYSYRWKASKQSRLGSWCCGARAEEKQSPFFSDCR